MTDTALAYAPLDAGAVVRDAGLAAVPGIAHGFFTREGGVSTGIYAGLNVGVGSGDGPEAVTENRGRAAATLGVSHDRLTTPYQVHSADVVRADAPFSRDAKPRADAVVTTTPGLAIGVVTADCGPVLFADAEAGVVAAAHAGWRGALGGVLEATIDEMERAGARREAIVAVLGPSITQPSYEVGVDMMDAVCAPDETNARFFAPGATSARRQFDLPGFILSRLSAAGLAARFVGACTYAQPERFFSFRRTTHRGEGDYGRQLSAIALV